VMCCKRLAGVGIMLGDLWQLVLHGLRAWVEIQTSVILLFALHILESINNISDYNTLVLPKPMLLQPKPFMILKKL